MLIGQLVKETGLSKHTIRFYEKKGLIQVGGNERRSNNYKEYSREILQRLLTIKRLKGFGFTLNEIAELLAMIDMNEASCNNITDKISKKVDMIDEKIRDLLKVRNQLLNGVNACKEGCKSEQPEENCSVLVSD